MRFASVFQDAQAAGARLSASIRNAQAMPETMHRHPVSLDGYKCCKGNHRSGADRTLPLVYRPGIPELQTKTTGRYNRPRTLSGIGTLSCSQYTKIVDWPSPSGLMVYFDLRCIPSVFLM